MMENELDFLRGKIQKLEIKLNHKDFEFTDKN